MSEDSRAVASAGASLLDQLAPGWATRVDVDSLDIDDSYSCILGQVYGDYFDGLKAIGAHVPEAADWSNGWAYRHGFMSSFEPVSLENAWADEIAKRLAKLARAPGPPTSPLPSPR